MKAPQRPLFTFGYEGLNIDSFVARLKEVGVGVIVDVRELPLSRKKGFSKTAFAETLNRHGIEYLHVPALGCPRPVRNAYRNNQNWDAYTRGFLAHLRKQKDAVAEVTSVSRSLTACLVCFESDFNYCHRSMVAAAIRAAGGPRIVHLTAKTEIAEVPKRAAA
ncbi:MAG: DUF488 domain-containing protein [Gammaproteobacteria bacterium]|nr:DUF488 domain-containing protein [Gammaproteobacteria bacterium]MBU1414534.1 DUF488 domain-containing protein [Gammaproteobacteria bacterium]